MDVRRYIRKFGVLLSKYIISMVYFACFCLVLGVSTDVAKNMIGKDFVLNVATAFSGWWLFTRMGASLMKIYKSLDEEV